MEISGEFSEPADDSPSEIRNFFFLPSGKREKKLNDFFPLIIKNPSGKSLLIESIYQNN
jgi:hypothetical protein